MALRHAASRASRDRGIWPDARSRGRRGTLAQGCGLGSQDDLDQRAGVGADLIGRSSGDLSGVIPA